MFSLERGYKIRNYEVIDPIQVFTHGQRKVYRRDLSTLDHTQVCYIYVNVRVCGGIV